MKCLGWHAKSRLVFNLNLEVKIIKEFKVTNKNICENRTKGHISHELSSVVIQINAPEYIEYIYKQYCRKKGNECERYQYLFWKLRI